jgi:hypothetical protein
MAIGQKTRRYLKMEKTEKTARLWASGFVNRWHNNKQAELRNAGDMVGGHAQRVAILYMELFGNSLGMVETLRNLTICILHDAPEALSGDIPHPAKQKVPLLGNADKEAEAVFWDELGEPNFSVKSREVALCDLLDAILFMCLRKPGLLHRADWLKDAGTCTEMAHALGVGDDVVDLINHDWRLI